MKATRTHVFHGFQFVPNPYGTARGWLLSESVPAWHKRLPLNLFPTLAKAREWANAKATEYARSLVSASV